MPQQPILMVYAGPNGSGKSSITQAFPSVGYYVNADEIQKQLNCSALEAAQIATKAREKLLQMNVTFSFETVLSTDRNLKLMQTALANGYRVICIYVLTRHPSINVKRVDHRVHAGGHSVDSAKIVQRYHRAMKLIPELCKACSRLLIFDNSLDNTDFDPSLIAEISSGEITTYPSSLWPYADIIQLLSGQYNPDESERL